jgi:ABC-2 type transport system permease protein
MACVLPPIVAVLLTQVLVVFVMLFSPLNFPAERLPDWLRAIHSVLPLQAMGEVIRGTLAGSAFPLPAGSFLMVGTWCIASLGVAYLALRRRA